MRRVGRARYSKNVYFNGVDISFNLTFLIECKQYDFIFIGYALCTKIEVRHFGLRKDLPEHTMIEQVLGNYIYKGEKNRGAPIYKLDTHHAKTIHADVMYNGHYWQGRVILIY